VMLNYVPARLIGFFFQAEDGIRDFHVTGVQTCALPISTAAMFYIDQQTIDYLKLTGREPEQVALVENYAKTTGLWADALKTADYERVLTFDLSSVVRNMAGPSNPHKRLPTTALQERGIADEAKLAAARAEEEQGLLPDGAVIIAA